jgi:hypothetical protein
MDLVTFATRVCKVMGVETMIGSFRFKHIESDGCSDHVHSYQCSWRDKSRLLCRRYCVPE